MEELNNPNPVMETTKNQNGTSPNSIFPLAGYKYLYRVLVVLIILAANTFSNAQVSDKTILAILPIECSANSIGYTTVASWLNEAVASAFITANRFTVVDRTKLGDIKNEQEVQKTEQFIDGKTSAQGKGLGAKYIVTGRLTGYSTQEVYNSKNEFQGYTGKVIFDIKIVDVETGELMASGNFKGSSGAGLLDLFTTIMAEKSTDAAVSSAIKSASSDVYFWIKKVFPVSIAIVEIQEKDDKKGARKILIAGGSSVGLRKGDDLKVVEIKQVNVDGKVLNRNVEIGRLRIAKVEDDNFSSCNVRDGGLLILEKLTSNVKLKVITLE